MLGNYFKIALRNLLKNKLYAVINILGLTTGLAACLLIGAYINNELSYDKFNVHADRIVRATMEYKQAGIVNTTAFTGTKVGPQFKRSFPSVQEYVRTYIGSRVIKSESKIFDESRILFADPAFFKVFSFPLIAGKAETALDAPDKMVISQSMSRKYFGSEDGFGRTLKMGGRDFKVSAVCADAPGNSQIKFDFVTQFLNLGNVNEEQWWTANWITYLLLKDEKSLVTTQALVKDYMNSPVVRTDAGMEGKNYLTYHLEPVNRVHLYSSLDGFEPNGSIRYIYMFALIAALILVIACANYTNLSIAQSAGRSGEIGMRKVMGASRRQLFVQFLAESASVTSIASVLAFLLAILLIPYFNRITGKQFSYGVLLQPISIVALVVFTLLVSFLAGIYPAFVLANTQISGVLKKGFHFTGSNNLLRKILVVTQFGISVFLIIYTAIILQQLHFMRIKNLGYDKDHLVVLPIGGTMLQNFQNTKDAFMQVPGVEGVTASYETPVYVQWGDGISATDEKGAHEISLNAIPVDLDFTKTMKMQLLSGRDFQSSDFNMMDTSDKGKNFRQPFMINETTAKKLGWTPQQSIGRTISKNVSGPVIGVVRDFNFSSLHDPIGPLVIFLGRDLCRDFMIRINGSRVPATLARLETVWSQRVPDRPFNYHFLDDEYNRLYLAEQRISALFTVAAGLAIVLSCLGLFGLAAFTAMQRKKEISIRRVLGANVSSITLMVANKFLQLVGIAILIATPVAWWAGSRWLQDFAYRIPMQLYVFFGTAMITSIIAMCTVGFISVKAALSNPVKNLRNE